MSATYTWAVDGSTLTIKLSEEDTAPTVVEVAKFSPSIMQAACKFGINTVLRNATAGKMDDLDLARKSIAARVALFMEGKWAAEGSAKAGVELSDEEKQDVISSAIVNAYKAKGSTKTAAQILEGFNALDGTQQSTVLTALKKNIDSAMKDVLSKKKKAAKANITLPGLPE